ncbi:kinase-like domain-containing protein [Pavlovales sp. CCMP2436]|nr:kinase-like domain-containing protein [Pavlovales sp. CCMP2436]
MPTTVVAVELRPAVEASPADSVDPLVAWQHAHKSGLKWSAPIHSGSAHFDEAYNLGEVIGHGAFGQVHSSSHRRTGAAVATKVITIPDHVARGPKAGLHAYEDVIRRELKTMGRLAHPNIISLIESFSPDEGARPREWRIVLELCAGCELQKLVEAHGALELEDVRVIAAQLCSAILHMHANGVVHRDIKPANIMVLGAELTGTHTCIKVPYNYPYPPPPVKSRT